MLGKCENIFVFLESLTAVARVAATIIRVRSECNMKLVKREDNYFPPSITIVRPESHEWFFNRYLGVKLNVCYKISKNLELQNVPRGIIRMLL